LPKVEGVEGKPLSPYAVTKAVNEIYADVFSRVYNFHSIGLRYFNIFGPRQNPNNPYAAVIPIFCKHFIENTCLTINGDGLTSRDFTFVENAVQANIKAFEYDINEFQVYNVACGNQTTLQEIVHMLNIISGNNVEIKYEVERKGDVRHSKASIEKIKEHFEYNPEISFKEGLELVYEWYKNNFNLNNI
jgi:UDP-N-acetylglucosamine 4-epimerase